MRREERRRLSGLGDELRRWGVGPGGLSAHVGLFLAVAAILTVFNLATAPADLWFWRPMVLWLIPLAAHAALTLVSLGREVGAPQAGRERPTVPTRLVPAGDGWGAAPMAESTSVGFGRGSVGLGLATRAAESLLAVVRRCVAGLVARVRSSRSTNELDGPGGSGEARVGGTDGWSAGPLVAPAGHATWTVPPRSGEAIDATWEAGPVPVGSDPTERWPAAVASDTGQSWGSAGRPVADAPGMTDDRDAGERGASDDRPAPIEAGWPSASEGGAESSGNGVADRRSVAAARPVRRIAETGQDIVLRGPFPVDGNDPRWTSLEAEAAAWLARREAEGTHNAPHDGGGGDAGQAAGRR